MTPLWHENPKKATESLRLCDALQACSRYEIFCSKGPKGPKGAKAFGSHWVSRRTKFFIEQQVF
jgi:hypothetical protein